MQLAFLAPTTAADTAPDRSSGAWWHDAPQRRLPDEPSLDEVSDAGSVSPLVRRDAVAWFARVEPTPVRLA